MGKTLKYGYLVLKYSIQANGFLAILSIISKLFENTLFPLIQVLLLSRLIDTLTNRNPEMFTQILWIGAAYVMSGITSFSLTTFLDVKQVYLDFQLESFIDGEISRKLATLDPATFEKQSFQNLLSQIDGVKGVMQMQLIRFANLIDMVVRCATAAVILATRFPIFIPVLFIATLPSFFFWNKFMQIIWPFFGEKRAPLLRITQYVKNLLGTDATSKEARIFNIGDAVLKKVDTQKRHYYQIFEKKLNTPIATVIMTRILQLIAFIYTQFVTITSVLNKSLTIGQFTLFFQQTLTLAKSSEDFLSQFTSMGMRNKLIDKYL